MGAELLWIDPAQSQIYGGPVTSIPKWTLLKAFSASSVSSREGSSEVSMWWIRFEILLVVSGACPPATNLSWSCLISEGSNFEIPVAIILTYIFRSTFSRDIGQKF